MYPRNSPAGRGMRETIAQMRNGRLLTQKGFDEERASREAQEQQAKAAQDRFLQKGGGIGQYSPPTEPTGLGTLDRQRDAQRAAAAKALREAKCAVEAAICGQAGVKPSKEQLISLRQGTLVPRIDRRGSDNAAIVTGWRAPVDNRESQMWQRAGF